MEIKDLEEFKADCNKGKCNRNTMKSKNCLKEGKQTRCYDKYISQTLKDNDKMFTIDLEWETLKEEVKKRDNDECQVWKSFSSEERKFVLNNFFDEYRHLSKTLDCAHILSRGSNPDLRYDLDNVVLCSRYLHGLLDSYKHPVTQENITVEEREEWFRKAMNDHS